MSDTPNTQPNGLPLADPALLTYVDQSFFGVPFEQRVPVIECLEVGAMHLYQNGDGQIYLGQGALPVDPEKVYVPANIVLG